MDELTATVLAVGRMVGSLRETEQLTVEHQGIHADRAAGLVLIEAVNIWGHRARVEHELREHGYQIETHHLIGAGRGWQIRVTPRP